MTVSWNAAPEIALAAPSLAQADEHGRPTSKAYRRMVTVIYTCFSWAIQQSTNDLYPTEREYFSQA